MIVTHGQFVAGGDAKFNDCEKCHQLTLYLADYTDYTCAL